MSPARTATVTIGVPFHDCAATLRETIQSVFAQSRGDWELLLVDDGSTDGSAALASAVDDPRVRVLSDGVNRGLVHRLNQIIDLAEAPYLCRMDADDVMHPRRLEAQLAFLEAHAEVDVVGSPMISIDEAGAIRGARGAGGATLRDPASVLAAAPFGHPTVTGRTQWFKANRYDARFLRAEDHELWCRTVRHSRFATVEAPLLFYREPARVNLRNYVLSCRTDRRIYLRYGPGMVGYGATAACVARSLAKEACYRAASRLGAGGRLVARRSRPLAPEELVAAGAALEQVRRTAVPGLDGGWAAVTRAAR